MLNTIWQTQLEHVKKLLGMGTSQRLETLSLRRPDSSNLVPSRDPKRRVVLSRRLQLFRTVQKTSELFRFVSDSESELLLRGPSFTVDAQGASALAAMGNADMSLRRHLKHLMWRTKSQEKQSEDSSSLNLEPEASFCSNGGDIVASLAIRSAWPITFGSVWQ